jgi:hypothetical protein
MKKFTFLERIYILLVILIILLTGFTPYLVNDGFYFFTQEMIEVVLIFSLFGVGIAIMYFLKKEIEKNRLLAENATKNLTEVFKHVGRANIYNKEKELILSGFKYYPKNESDFKHVLRQMGERILSFVETDYVLMRVIDKEKGNVVSEFFVTRGDQKLPRPIVSDRDLLDTAASGSYSFFSSETENVSERVFAVFPPKEFDGEQELMVKAILNQIQMIYLIFASKNRKNNNEK